jgi:hypothetical protein
VLAAPKDIEQKSHGANHGPRHKAGVTLIDRSWRYATLRICPGVLL